MIERAEPPVLVIEKRRDIFEKIMDVQVASDDLTAAKIKLSHFPQNYERLLDVQRCERTLRDASTRARGELHLIKGGKS